VDQTKTIVIEMMRFLFLHILRIIHLKFQKSSKTMKIMPTIITMITITTKKNHENEQNDWSSKLSKIKVQTAQETFKKVSGLLETQNKFDQFCLSYADILNRWGLVNQRTEVLQFVNKKFLENTHNEYEAMDICIECPTCHIKCQQPYCKSCTTFLFHCSFCELALKGLCMFCFECGHGGHPEHMHTWFSSESTCPVQGCSCACFFCGNVEVSVG